jgi:hypothetical protein
MYNFFEALFLIGVGVVVLAGLWFLVRLFRTPRRLWLPIMLGLVGLAITATPVIYTRVVETIDLGEREQIVDGELHLTLTGWDRDSYEFLAYKRDIAVLQMANADVTDATLAFLKGQVRLKTLDLNDSQVTDQGLAILAEVKSLESMKLRGTKVTDAGLQQLFDSLPKLKQLDLRQTSVSSELIDSWKAAQPGRRVLK